MKTLFLVLFLCALPLLASECMVQDSCAICGMTVYRLETVPDAPRYFDGDMMNVPLGGYMVQLEWYNVADTQRAEAYSWSLGLVLCKRCQKKYGVSLDAALFSARNRELRDYRDEEAESAEHWAELRREAEKAAKENGAA